MNRYTVVGFKLLGNLGPGHVLVAPHREDSFHMPA
jgi:hypothetical protein